MRCALSLPVAGVLCFSCVLAGEKPLSPADEKYRGAGALFARGEFVRAASEYAAFARKYRTDRRAAEAGFRSAESLYRAGESEKARAAFENCLKLKLPQARLAAAQLRIGAIHYAAGNAAGAAATLSKLRANRLSSDARAAAAYFLGASLLGLGKKKQALPQLRLAAAGKEARIAAPALLALARLETAAGRAPAAARYLNALLRKFPTSAEAPEAGFRSAEFLRAAGKTAEALPLYAAVLKRSPPGELAARSALGAAWSHLSRAEGTKALKMADLAARSKALGTESSFARGLALMLLKKYTEAEQAFGSIVKSNPQGARAEGASCRLVWCRHLGGRTSQVGLAAREFRARFAKSRLNSEVAYVEGLAAAARKDLAGALAALDRAAADPKRPYAAEGLYRAALLLSKNARDADARTRLERLVKEHPRHRLTDPALVRLGELLLAAGEARKATASFSRHLTRFPRSRHRPAALLGLALCSAAAGDFKTFAARCSQLVKGHPSDPRAAEAGYWLAWSFERQKRYDVAIGQYNALIARYKRPPLVYEFKYRLCCAYYLNGNYPKAADGFLGLVRSGKRKLPAEALLWLGRYLGGQGRSKEASEVYALAAASRDPSARAEARLALGHQALEAGKAAEAAKLYRKLLTEDPKSARADDARLGLARALRESGSPKDAAKIAAELATSKDERTRLAARGELALAELVAGDAAQARKSLEPLAILYDDSTLVPGWLAGLARAEEKLGRKRAALKWWRELITRYPASREAKAASKHTGIALPKRPPKPGTDF